MRVRVRAVSFSSALCALRRRRAENENRRIANAHAHAHAHDEARRRTQDEETGDDHERRASARRIQSQPALGIESRPCFAGPDASSRHRSASVTPVGRVSGVVRQRGGEGRVRKEASSGRRRCGEVGVQLAGLEAAEADDVPEGAGDVAAELVAAVGGEGGPAFGGGEEDGEAAGGGDVPEADGAVGGGGGEGACRRG